VPKGDDGVGFEVRSLQEFTAARALVTGSDEEILLRLDLSAPSAHWRNAWLLAVGRVFAMREHLRPRVVALLRELDARSLLSAVIPLGPDLAFDLLEDDLAGRSPQYRRQLLQHALAIFEGPPTPSIGRRAKTLLDIGQDSALRPLITSALDRAMQSTADRRATAWLVCGDLELHTGELPAVARRLRMTAPIDDLRLAALREWDSRHFMTPGQRAVSHQLHQAARATPLGELLRPHIPAGHWDGGEAGALGALLDELDSVGLSVSTEPLACLAADTLHTYIAGNEAAAAVVTNPEAREIIAEVLLRMPPDFWPATSTIRAHLAGAIQRLPVGRALRS
jgi:hypothetical protein